MNRPEPEQASVAAGAKEGDSRAPIRILFVDHARAMGGAETSLLILMRHLDPERYQPILACREGDLMDRAKAASIEVRSLEMPRLRRSLQAPLDLVRVALALRRLAREEQCSLVHANVLRASLYAAPAARLAGIPWVWHVRDILPSGGTTRRLCKASNAVICISDAVRRHLPCAAKAVVIHNPIEPSSTITRSREELQLPPDGELIASVGRLRRWKGHHRFIEAAAQLHDSFPNLHFLIIGGRIFTGDESDADYPDDLRALAAEKGLQSRLHFLGHRQDLAEIWPHLSALTHLGDAEPFGRVVAEAQMNGVPAVGFDEGGLPEIIEPGLSGFLHPKGDLLSVVHSLSRILSEEDLAKRLSAEAAANAGIRFHASGHAQAVQAVYDSLLPSHSPGER